MATQADKINTGALATIVVVLAVSTFGIAAALTALVRYETATRGAEVGVTANLRSYRELSAKQRSELTADPAWVDKDTQRVSVSVERAMDLVLQDLRKDPNLATEAAADAGAAPAPAPQAQDGGAKGSETPEKPGTTAAPKPGQPAAPKPAQPTPAGKPPTPAPHP